MATGRHSLDGAKTIGLCSLPEMPCALLLLLALPQGSNPAHINHAAARSSPSLAVTAAPGDCICTRPRVGRKCPLQAACRSDSEALPCLLHCPCLAHTCQGHATQSELLRTCRGRSSPRFQSATSKQIQRCTPGVQKRHFSMKTTRHCLPSHAPLIIHKNLLPELSKAVRGHADWNWRDQIASRRH